MKVVVTAQGPAGSDAVDPRFGRAPFFVVYDEESDAFTPLDNAAQADAAQGAGVQAAQRVVAAGARALLTGHCGPKAFQVLRAADVQVYSGLQGTVAEAVAAWRAGNCRPLTAPDGTPQH